MRITVLVAAVALATAGCLGGGRNAESATSIDGYGLSVLASEGWSGRVSWPGPEYAITLEATSAKRPPASAWAAGDLLGEDDAYVAVIDIGLPPAGIGREAAWTVDPELPLAITSADVLGPFQGGFPRARA